MPFTWKAKVSDQNPIFYVLLAGDGRLRVGWRILIYLIGFVVVEVIAVTGAAIVVIVVMAAAGEPPGPDMAARLQGDLLLITNTAALLPSLPLLLGLTWVCRRFLDRRSLAGMGLGSPRLPWISLIPLALFAGGLPIAAGVAILTATGRLGFAGLQLPPMAFYVTPMFIGAAFVEELIFRGYIQSNLMERGRVILAVTISAVLFGLLHSFNPGVWKSTVSMLNLIVAGVLLAAVYLWSQDLWFPTVMHFAWNATQGVVFGIPVSGMQINGVIKTQMQAGPVDPLTGGSFGLEGSVIILGLQFVMIGVFVWLYRRRQQDETDLNPGLPPVPPEQSEPVNPSTPSSPS